VSGCLKAVGSGAVAVAGGCYCAAVCLLPVLSALVLRFANGSNDCLLPPVRCPLALQLNPPGR
jgi:hypothetical protein